MANKGKLTPPKTPKAPMGAGALSAATPGAATPTPGAAPMPVKKVKRSLKPKTPKPAAPTMMKSGSTSSTTAGQKKKKQNDPNKTGTTTVGFLQHGLGGGGMPSGNF